MKHSPRLATRDDLPLLEQLASDCLDAPRAPGMEPRDEPNPAPGRFATAIAAGTLHLGCDERGMVLACANLDPGPADDGREASGDGAPALAVQGLLVHPAPRALEIASRLLRHGERIAVREGRRSIRLSDGMDDSADRAWLRNLGYRPTGAAPGDHWGWEKLIPVREMQPEDLPAAMALWSRCEGVGLTPEETPEMLSRFLFRNEGISSSAIVDGRLAGALLGGHDGRRGFLYHLAVEPAQRGQGLGALLVERTLSRLAILGLAKATILVFGSNEAGAAFWRREGWKKRRDLKVMQFSLHQGAR